MPDLPLSLSYYGSSGKMVKALKQRSLPLLESHELGDPFMLSRTTELPFDCQDLFEATVKNMTASILGKSAPKGNPNHPLLKAMLRWRGEGRFSDEAEIRESLVGLLPAMVEKTFNEARAMHQDWQAFVDKKRIIPFFESATDSNLWRREGENYSGIAIKFKSEEGSLFENCQPINYSKTPPSSVGLKDCVEYMVGASNEIPCDFQKTLLTQNYDFRAQKGWRYLADIANPTQFSIELPIDLVQGVYIGANVSTDNARRIASLVGTLSKSINVYQARCSEYAYEFNFDKVIGE